MSYASAKESYASLPAFKPLVPTAALPFIALITLCAAFALTFTLTTLPKSRNPVPELATAFAAAVLAGGGIVALFCSAGVYV